MDFETFTLSLLRIKLMYQSCLYHSRVAMFNMTCRYLVDRSAAMVENMIHWKGTTES